MADLFAELLAVVDEATASLQQKTLKEDPNFLKQVPKSAEDVMHTGLTDSSDDEDNRDCLSAKYNECGRAVKHLLDADYSSSSSQSSANSSTWRNSNPLILNKYKTKEKPQQQQAPPKPTAQKIAHDVYTDPIFGIRIVNPLVFSITFKDRMQGRQAIPLAKLRMFVESVPANADWVVAGVIVQKTGKTSQKGNPFSIWTLSDLHGDLKTMSLFLFGSAYKDLWKCSLGTVIGVLNPTVFEKKRDSKDEACLSVDNVQKVMILGQSKDYSVCKSIKKDGSACTSFVNLSKCEFCVYHVRQEYQKCSKRSDLQSTFSGRGLTALRNKVLGKNEVFYAGKSFMAIPAAKSGKLQAKDQEHLRMLSGLHPKSKILNETKDVQKRPGMVQHVEVSATQRLKDIEWLKKLSAREATASKTDTEIEDEKTQSLGDVNVKIIAASKEVTLEGSKTQALSVIAKLKQKKAAAKEIDKEKNPLQGKENNEKATTSSVSEAITQPKPSTSMAKTNFAPKLSGLNIPVLSGISGNKLIDLSSPITKTHVNRANINALKYVQHNGPIQKQDPNKVKTPKTGNKRLLEALDKDDSSSQQVELDPKRQKIQANEHFSQRFKQMMAATSAHADLLDDYDNEQADKYFDKLEMKERMEEKMIGTYKVQCKAVRCLQCKYTSFSAADRCKEEKHPLKVYDAMKRFFKCGDCGNRTVSLNVIPTMSCKKCGGGKWERTGMMKEKIAVPKGELSIRGGEQTFVNSNATNANINLLVPDD